MKMQWPQYREGLEKGKSTLGAIPLAQQETRAREAMNETIQVIQDRQSIRSFEDRPIEDKTKQLIINCAMRAPTAGNMMLYSMIEITQQATKDKLAESCDHQPFIAQAPLVLLFLADYQRWYDLFQASDVRAYCELSGREMRRPGEGDLLLACCDALIAAQTAVIAAESLGISSCYIGDILEQHEYHRDLLNLPQYTLPITMVCFGYARTKPRNRTPRFPQELVYFKDTYKRLNTKELDQMARTNRQPARYVEHATNIGQHVYGHKFSADFSFEMTRSSREAIHAWVATPEEDA